MRRHRGKIDQKWLAGRIKELREEMAGHKAAADDPDAHHDDRMAHWHEYHLAKSRLEELLREAKEDE